jgi:hypothetical protein
MYRKGVGPFFDLIYLVLRFLPRNFHHYELTNDNNSQFEIIKVKERSTLTEEIRLI